MKSLIPLSDCISLFGGGTPSKQVPEYWNGEIPWASVKDLKSSRLKQTQDSITDLGLKNSSSKLVKSGTLLIATRMAVGKAAITDIDVAINQDLKAIVCKENIDVKYLFYFLSSSENEFAKVSSGATVKGIKLKHILDLKIRLPPLAEQKQIAAILDAADSLRQKDQQLVEHYTTLSQSLFLEMFGDPVSNPMGWDKSLADPFIDLLTGYAFKSKDYSDNQDDIHLCGGLIISPDGIEWDKANFWSKKHLAGLDRYKLQQGDIVMAMDRPWISSGFKIHKITNDDKEALLVQRTARIRGKGINQDFLYFLFKHPAFERQVRTTETTVPHISPKDIRNYNLIFPPIALQNQFAERVAIIEQQKQQAQANLEKSEALFNSLLQRAFTGELTADRAA